jgi:hypothetical protein
MGTTGDTSGAYGDLQISGRIAWRPASVQTAPKCSVIQRLISLMITLPELIFLMHKLSV